MKLWMYSSLGRSKSPPIFHHFGCFLGQYGHWPSLVAEEYGYAMLEVNRSNTIIKFLNSEGKAVDGWISGLLVAATCLFVLIDIQHASASNPQSAT